MRNSFIYILYPSSRGGQKSNPKTHIANQLSLGIEENFCGVWEYASGEGREES